MKGKLVLLLALMGIFGVSVSFSRAQDKPEAGLLLVLNKADSTLVLVDPASLKVIARISTGEAPHEVAVSSDGRIAYVCNYGTGPKPGISLSVIDVSARKESKRIDLGGLIRPHGIEESGGKVYFTVEGSRAVARLDPTSGKLDWVVGTGQTGTHMLVAAPDGRKIYTANIGSDTVSVLEPGTPKLAHIGVGKGPEGIAVSSDGREVWVAHRGDGELSIIDTTTDKVKEKIRVGRSPIRVKFTADGKRVLISDPQSGEVIVIDSATRKELKRIQVGGGPVGILVTPDGRRAFVARSQANKVSVINLDDLTVSGEFEPGKQPDGLGWAR